MSPFNWAHRVLINPSTGPKRAEQETLPSQEREKEEDFNREVTDLVHTWLWGRHMNVGNSSHSWGLMVMKNMVLALILHL